MSERNGTAMTWIMRILLALVMLGTGGITASFQSRLAKVESEVSYQHYYICALLDSICRLEEKVDNLREDLTNKPVYRQDCRRCP